MKTRVSKTPAVQAKKNGAFFGKEGKGAFFGAAAGKESRGGFFGGGAAAGGGAVQCKLTVGQPNDIYEKEADATADKIVQRLAQPGKEKTPVTPEAGLLQKKPIFESEADPKEGAVQRKEAGSGAPAVTSSVESGIRSSKGSGSTLPSGTRQQMESGLGADLSGVRIHTDSSAGKMSKDLNAQAFTHGKDVYFNSGKYNPASTSGKHLLAHELTHVVQQNKGLSRKPDISRKESGTAVAAPGNAMPAQAPVMSVPTVQMAPGGGSGSTDIKDMDPADVAAIGKTNEGYIDKEKKEGPAKVHFDNFPFKQYAGDFLSKDKQGNEYTAQKPYLKPTEERKTKQGPVWRKAALPLVTETLNDTVSRKNIKGPNFLLTVKNSNNLRVTGTVDQLAQQVTVPFWNKDGKPVNHQIEHKIDWQVSGGNHNVDVISNLLLLEGAENLRIGLVVMGNMKEAYNKIIAFYKKNKVTGLVEGFEDAKGVYPIWTENLALTGLPVSGSMYTLTQMQKGDADNPLDDKVVDLIDEKLNPGELVLRTSQKGGGNVVRYDFNNKFMEVKGNADKHELTSITLKNVVKDDKGNLDQTNPNKTLDFTKESQDHYKVKTDGFALYLKDTIRGMKNLSEIVWSDVEFDPFTGWYANGQVNTTVPFLDKANITITLESSVFTLEATITSTALQGKLPSPFNIDYCSLSLIASSDLEFAVGGEVGFSIGKDGNQYGKGHIGGKAGTAGFQLDGGFEFDKKYFTGNLSVNYEKNGAQENWKVDGSINLKKNVIKNVDSLKIDFSYGTNATGGKTLSGSGTAMLSLPGIKSIGITASLDDQGVFTIGGTFELNDLPKLKGGKGRIIVTKSGDDWDIDVQGSVKPDLDIKFLTLDEVAVSYHKGVFDVHSGAKFEKGKVSGNFTVGVTNQPVSKDGQMTPGTGGKDLKFYASGQINVDIVEGVGGQVGIKITPEGDILLNGEVGLTKDKELFSMPPLNENVFTLSQNIPLASCGIVTLSLHFGGKVDIYAHLNPLTFDKGSKIGLTNVSLKDFSHAKITSHLSVSSHLDAGIKLGLELGLDAALLGILHATVDGTGDLDFRALDAGLTVTFGAEWSADQGAKLTEGEMKVHLASKLIASLGATAKVSANLLFTTITLWSHHWDLAQKEWNIGLFGSGDLIIPLPIGNDGKISMTPKDVRGQLSKLEGAVNNDNMSKNSMDLMEGKGTTDEDQTSQSSEVIKKEVIARFTDPVRFEFNKSVNYIQERYKLVNYLRGKMGEEQKIDLSYVEGLIKKCEYEEYEKFGPYIQAETFPSDTKYLLIDDFMVNHPTLGAAEKVNLRSNVVPDKKDDNVQKKEIGPEPVIQRNAETDSKGAYTGNYIFDPGHGDMNAGFFNKVKKDVADGVLDDNEIKALRADAIGRNGTVMHAEQLLMAAMRNPVNVTRMKAYTGGSLVIPMSDIKEADKNYMTNFGVEKNPLDTSAYIGRVLASVFGLSKEKVADILTEYDNKAMDLIHHYAGKQFSDQADRLIVFCQDTPVVPWDDVINAMLNGAADGTEGDRIMAGSVYAIAVKAGHLTAPKIGSGRLKIDALIPSVYKRIAGDGEASYQYSTDEDVLKADTFYIQTDMDVFKLRHRALVIHELTHAADDFAASGPTSKKEDSLTLESHAYKEQGKYMMDQIIGDPTATGFVDAAARYAHDADLYYWSMVAAAKGDVTKYGATLVSIGTHAPMTKTAAAVKADLALSAADLEKKVRDALVAYRTPKGKQLYTPGTTTIGGPGGHYFVQRSCDPNKQSCAPDTLDHGDTGPQQCFPGDAPFSQAPGGNGGDLISALFGQPVAANSKPSDAAGPGIPKVSGDETQLLLQTEYKPTLDLLVNRHSDAEAALQRNDWEISHADVGVSDAFEPGTSGVAGPIGERTVLLVELSDSKQALDGTLQLVGLSDAAAVPNITDRFIDMFRSKAREVANFMLDQSEIIATAEYQRYSALPFESSVEMVNDLRQSTQRLGNIQRGLVQVLNIVADEFAATQGFWGIGGHEKFDEDNYTDSLGGSVLGASPRVQSELKHFRGAIEEEGLKFPVLMKEKLNYVQLGYHTSDQELIRSAMGIAAQTLDDIKKSREKIDDDNVWDLKPVIAATVALFHLTPQSYAFTYLQEYLQKRELDKSILDIFLAAVNIILAIVAIFATGGLAIFAIVGGAALGGVQTYRHYKRYTFEKAARGSSLDTNQSIGRDFDPSALSLAFDVAMTFISFLQAASAVRGLGAAFNAAEQTGVALERVGVNANSMGFGANVQRLAAAKGFAVEQVAEDTYRITHAEMEGEYILTRQSIRYQTPLGGTGMRTEFEVPFNAEAGEPQGLLPEGSPAAAPADPTKAADALPAGPGQKALPPGSPAVQPPRPRVPRVQVGEADLDAMRLQYNIPGNSNTIGMGRTDVEGLAGRNFYGGSRTIRAYAPIPDSAPHIYSPRTMYLSIDHAEQDIANDFIDAVEAAKLKPGALEGKTLAMHISHPRGPCFACMQGEAGSGVNPGILFQLSNRYPGLIIRVTWLDAQDTLQGLVIVGGVRY